MEMDRISRNPEFTWSSGLRRVVTFVTYRSLIPRRRVMFPVMTRRPLLETSSYSARPLIILPKLLLIPVAVMLSVGCSDQKQKTASEDEIAKGAPTMQVTSTAFKEGESIPASHGHEDQNLSPPLKWSDVPPSAKSFALICDDPDAPRGTWV